MKVILHDKSEHIFHSNVIKYSDTLEREQHKSIIDPKYTLVIPDNVLLTKKVAETIQKFLEQLDIIVSKYHPLHLKEILTLKDTFVSHIDYSGKSNTPNINSSRLVYTPKYAAVSSASSSPTQSTTSITKHSKNVQLNNNYFTNSSSSISSSSNSIIIDDQEFHTMSDNFGGVIDNTTPLNQPFNQPSTNYVPLTTSTDVMQSVSLEDNDIHYPNIELSDPENYIGQHNRNSMSGDDSSDAENHNFYNSGHSNTKINTNRTGSSSRGLKNNNNNNQSSKFSSVLYAIYNINEIDVKGMGSKEKDGYSMLEALVLSAHYLEIKENLLVRAIRFQLECSLMGYPNASDVCRFLHIMRDFDQDTEQKINLEMNFGMDEKFQSNQDLFESMVDGPKIETFNNKSGQDIVQDVKKRRLMIAVKDASVNLCHGCNSAFGLYLRRHHCRECGYIFCDSCTGNRIDSSSVLAPKYMDSLDYYSGRQLRVCNECHSSLQQKKEFGYVEQMLRILSLKLPLIRRFSSLCMAWRKASVSYLSDIREIQYLFPTHKFQQFEIEALWRNKEFFRGHSKWVLKLLESINWSTITEVKVKKILSIINDKQKIFSCYHMMCSTSCQSCIPLKDVFPLLDKNITNQHIRNFAVDIISHISDHQLVYFIPQLVYYLRFEASEISRLQEFLFERALKSKSIAHFVMLEFKNCQTSSEFDSRYEILKSKLLILLDKDVALNYINTFEFLDQLQKFPQVDGPQLQMRVSLVNEMLSKHKILYPTDPSLIITRIENCSVSNSATKPIKMVADCIHQEDGTTCQKILFFKKDDIRKDRIVLNIISMMTYILMENMPIINDQKSRSLEAFNQFISCAERSNYEQAYQILKNNHDVRSMIAITKPESYNKIIEACECSNLHDLKENPFKDFQGGESRQKLLETLKKEIKSILESIVTYSVLPSGSQYGYIDAVVDSTTLAAIYRDGNNNKSSVHLPIHSYLMNQDNCQIMESHKNFTYSLSFWLVLTHLIGVGDRHLDNIMITKNGKFFHIDYGFILGKEPKPVANYIRYSQEYLSTSSLTNNINFNAVCSLIFGILRREAPFFLYHLMFLTRLDSIHDNSSRFSAEYIQNEVANRFFPGLPSHDAIKYFENLLDSHKDSMSQKFTDVTRELTKMTPVITDYAQSTLSTFGSIIKNSFPSYWGYTNNK